MKAIISAAVAAALTSGVTAVHGHRHAHRHVKKSAAEVDKRDTLIIEYVEAPEVTVYELGGQPISNDDAQQGLQDGTYIIIGETDPTWTQPAPVTSTIAPSSTWGAGQFYESKGTPAPTPASNPGGTGLNAHFPSGSIPCSNFGAIAGYGAIAQEYLGLGGFTGVQQTPNFLPGDASISYIVTGIPGTSCVPNSYCSYACPAGYEKTQWPSAQGATLQSIGGLYCNKGGMLELSRPQVPTLCEPGAGGITIVNTLTDLVSVCRTDYPGTESMTIPLSCAPGSSNPLTNTNSPTYYQWDGKPTTAQYYVNRRGVDVQDACLWNSPLGQIAGNWAPINIGVGKNSEGITYLSIFPNAPTSTATLDFNIKITGDVSTTCQLVNGAYSGGGNGCTVAVPNGGSATITFF